MGERFLLGISVTLIGTLALTLFPFFALGQDSQPAPDVQNTSTPITTPVTLWMEGQRGDAQYARNSIQLRQPCQNSDETGCECRVRFATGLPEFADYIGSFGESKVPVVYQVICGPDGRAVSARFLSVGTWSRDKFPSPNDGLIGIGFRNQAPQKGQHLSHRMSLPADCFPSIPGQNSSGDSAIVPTPHPRPKPEEAQRSQRVHISRREAQSLLITRVQREYPQEARDKRIQGTVILKADISEEGNVTELAVISGHPLLAPAALEAVKQWRYKPYLVKGVSAPVETEVQVNFVLPQK